MMWGSETADSAVFAKEFFLEHTVKNVLIPGIGYGRNAKVFLDNGMNVTGIEISQTAIDLARTYIGPEIPIYHGSVTDMPFDDKEYDGIFCYALIHLLDSHERAKLIQDCYAQLQPGGCMVFVAISKKAPMYAIGKKLGKDRFERMEGVQMFFYDTHSIEQEFGHYGLIQQFEIEEHQGAMPFITAVCRKEQ